jgi:ABC-type uncharacterized transport system permease subunit
VVKLHALLADASFYVSVLLYLAALVIFFSQLAGRWAGNNASRLAPALLAVATAGHFLHVLMASVIAKVCPVESVYFALSVASMTVSVFYLLARFKWNIHALGAFVAPIGMSSLLGTKIVGLGGIEHRLPPSFLAFHVGANLVGDALFTLACASAILYLVAEKRLKEKKRASSIVGRLPSLDTLDRAEHRFLLTGFPLLTLGIVSGTVWAHRLETGHAGELLRAALGYITWIIFAAVLLLRAAAGWRGRKAALGTITGFVFAIIVLLVYLIRPTVGGPS